MMNRTDDAKARLQALHQPVPKPTKAAIAQNKAEEDSRRESSTVSKVLRNFQKHPDVAQASRVGEPTLVDPQVVSATSVVQEATRAMMGSAAPGDNSVAIETVGNGPLKPDQPAPRSDSPAPETLLSQPQIPLHLPLPPTPDAAAQDANELKPNVAPDPNELKPNVDNGAPAAPAPTQVNEIQNGADNPGTNAPAAAAAGATKPADGASSSSTSSADDKTRIRPLPPASTRKRRACGRLSPSESRRLPLSGSKRGGGNRHVSKPGAVATHSSLTTGNVLTVFFSLTYSPAPINFRLSPPHQRKSLGAKNTACRRQRDCPEHGPPDPYGRWLRRHHGQ